MSVSCWYRCSDCDSSSLTGQWTTCELWRIRWSSLCHCHVGTNLDFHLLEGTAGSRFWSQSQQRETVVGRCVASELCCEDFVVTVGVPVYPKQCALSQMGKWLRRTDIWPGYSSRKPLTDCFWISSYSCSLTTASHCCVTGQDLLQQFTYWSPGANLGKKASCSFKAVRVEAPMERITIDILGPLPETPLKEQIYTVG